MPDFSDISKAISKKKQLTTNLPKYITNMSTSYCRLSNMKFSLDYYMFSQQLEDGLDIENAGIAKYVEKLKDIVENYILKDVTDCTQILKDILDIRRAVIEKMEVVTSFVDRLAIYEHIFNRIEFRFDESNLDEKYYNNDFTNDIMHYILGDSDATVTNSRICEVVGQLPMRLTRQKFFDIIKNMLTLYKGSSVASLNDCIYMIKTVSGIYKPEGFDTEFPELFEIYNKLSNVDYAGIDKAGYDEMIGDLRYACDQISLISDMYVSFMELINDAYVYLTTRNNSLMDLNENDNCRSIIKAATDMDEDVDVNDCFIALEGHQEKVYNKIIANDYVIGEFLSNLSEEAEAKEYIEVFNELAICQKLLSGSNFVSLDNAEADEAMVDEEILQKTGDELIALLKAQFSTSPMIVNRAIMAIVLSSLPVFFNNVDEIQSYINTSLAQCSDIGERKAVVNLIRMIMDEA